VRALLAVVSLGEEAAEGSWTAAGCSAARWERRVGRGVAAMGFREEFGWARGGRREQLVGPHGQGPRGRVGISFRGLRAVVD